jgi:hypothetical protein
MKDKDPLLTPGKTPDLDILLGEIDQLADQASYFYERMGVFYDTRYALWDGQSDDGRKWEGDEDGEVFPWEGSSDTRVRLADRIIKSRKRLRKLAFWGKRIKAKPLGSQSQDWATTVNPLLTWMLYTHNLRMMKRETNLLWSYQDTLGAAVLGVFWNRETRLERQQFSIEALQAWAMQSGDPGAMRLVEQVRNPLQDEQTIDQMREHLPHLKKGTVQKFLTELRLTGESELPVPYIFRNTPRWVAMRPFIDVFFDPIADDLQACRLIHHRELLTEADLWDKVESEHWDEEFVKEASQHKGEGWFSATDPLYMSERPRWSVTQVEDIRERVEIISSYYKTFHDGAVEIYCTKLHRSVKDKYALHEPLDYAHGEMPFTGFACETEERPIMESRGVPEIVMTWQREIKTQRDGRQDRTSMEILPALVVPKGLAGRIELGPGQQLETSRKGEYSFLQPPGLANTTQIVEADVMREVNEFYGLFYEGCDPQMVLAARQELVTDALNDLIPAITQTFQLAQQYLTDEDVQRVVGHLRHPFRTTRQEIQGKFDLEFVFDVRNWDAEFIEQIVKTIKDVILPMDRLGTVDTSKLVSIALNAIDPNLADAVLQPAQAAALQEVDDQQSRLGRIWSGIEPPQKSFANPGLRMNVLQNTVKSNPAWQQRAQQDPVFGKLLENEGKMLQFAIAQTQTNPEIGKFGAKPVLGGDGSGIPPMGMSRLDQSTASAMGGI